MPMTLAASMPPITVVPMIWRATEPAPEAVHSGTQPRINANDVIRIGRSRSRAPSSAASTRSLPFLEFVLGELDNQNRVLGRQTDEHHQTDLRIHVASRSAPCRRARNAPSITRRSHSTANAPNTATGVLNRTLNGSDQLSYSAARIRKTNKQRESENHRRRHALLRLLLLERHAHVVVAHFARHAFERTLLPAPSWPARNCSPEPRSR